MTSLDFTTILTTLEANLTRQTVSTKKYGETTSWTKNTTFSVTYNDGESTTITNCTRICLLDKNGIKVYVNHHNRHKLTTLTLSDLTSFTIT